jgi:hypothetical protein
MVDMELGIVNVTIEADIPFRSFIAVALKKRHKSVIIPS